MFKLFTLLCAGIFLTMLLAPREGGPVRYGLMPGKMPPLAFNDPEKPSKSVAEEPIQLASAEPTIIAPQPSAAPRPEATRQRNGLVQAAYSAPKANPPSTLTLALPLVRQDGSRIIADTPAREPHAEPYVQYVQGTSVNVRSGASAETESLMKLDKGEAVLVLPSDTPGWSMIRIEGDGIEGYVASRFLGERVEDGLFSSVD